MATDDSTFSKLLYDDRRPFRSSFFRRVRVDAHAVLLALTLIGLSAMAWGYITTLKPVALVVNQYNLTIFSNQTTVAGVLDDAAIPLMPEDVVFPALNAPLPDNQPIAIRRAYPIQIQVDGDTITRRTLSKTVGEALSEAGITIKPGDQIVVDGGLVGPRTALVRAESTNPFDIQPVLPITIRRAVPLQVDDNGAQTTFYTTAPTLGEALRQAGLVVYLGDYVSPDLGTLVTPGWQVYIRRSRPATIAVDGRTIQTRTRNETVGGLLAQEGIQLVNLDYSIPAAAKPVNDGMTVQVMRVREDIITESEPIAYETVWQADPTIEIDEQKTVQVGVQGVKKRQIRTRYENGREVRRALDREWIDAAPITQLINYGTKIVKRDLTLPDGTVVKYWRKISVLATSYTAATSGKARTNPLYGITKLGWQAGTGIIAVDPRLINLRSVLYVPGYGLAQAGDTGGKIKGRRIDLGYNEADLVLWYKWVEVYLLDPVPPADQIPYVIPAAPRDH
ncbi:MAG: DUF348 domain-containing protein [Chloroflexi bacterium]|nr:DUF348 domain-containing protein [Chloroflexota bacterium]